MQKANPWLEDLLHISEGTPYHSTLVVPQELRTQAPTPESGEVRLSQHDSMPVGVIKSKDMTEENSMATSDDLKIEGITIFQLDRGILVFQFFNDHFIERYNVFAASGKLNSTESNIMLQISSVDFNYPVRIDGDFNDSFLKGTIITQLFGKDDESLDGVAVLLRGLPERRYGNKAWIYCHGIIHGNEITIAKDGRKIISSRRIGWQTLSAFDFKVDGWSVSLLEIPHERRNDPSVTHLFNITKVNKASLTGKIVREFIDDNLFPFFRFLFGQRIFPQQIEGRKSGHLILVETFRTPKILPTTNGNNWFLRYPTCDSSLNIELQLQNFYNLPSNIKKQWQKVINHYVHSEEIWGTLREATIALSISFSALEGLTRSIISTYEDRDQWLKEDLRLKQSKGILEAIEMVAEREFGKHSKVFTMASQQIRAVRNATVHLDLVSEEDLRNAFFRWNSSQALIEILLLKKMGMTEPPNRTILPTFEINGQDMFADERKEELSFDQDQPKEKRSPSP